MTKELILPKFNMDMESAVLVRWVVEDGARVSTGDPVAEVETDKVNMEVEATADGILCGLRFSPGDPVPVTAPMASIAPDERAAAQVREALAARAGADDSRSTQETPQEASQPGSPETVSATGETPPPRRVRASPAIRRLARDHGIDLGSLADAGGRVTPGAVRAAVERREADHAAAPSAAMAASPVVPPSLERDGEHSVDAVSRSPLDPTRRTIAERMTQAGQVPQITLTVEAHIGPLVQARDTSVARPSFSAIFAVAVAKALRDHPTLNSTFEHGMVASFAPVHLGIAVARPSGLIVPVLRNADRLTVFEADRQIRDLVGRARDGRLGLGDVSGGTFTISSLGEVGVDSFTPLLNPPQVGILAIGRIARRVIPVENGIVVEPTVHLSLACDHRVIDGEPGAAFLRTLKGLLEGPTWLAASLLDADGAHH